MYRPLRTSAELCGRAIKMRRAAPPPDLAPYVMEFWQYEVAPDVDAVPIQVFPNGCVSMRFNIRPHGPLRVEPVLYGPSLHNNMHGWFFSEWGIFGVALNANRAYHLLGLSLHELRDLRLQFDCLWPAATRRVCEQMEETQATQDFAARIRYCSDFLRTLLRHDVQPSSDFLNAFDDIVAHAPYYTDLGGVAARQQMNTRSLRRHFAKYFGLSPKQLNHLVRVHQAMTTLRRQPGRNLAALALDTGFSDQAHLTRSFKELLNCSPKKFAGAIGTYHEFGETNWSMMDPYYARMERAPPVVRFG